jgi:anti-sigma factor RsiW
MDAPDHTTLQEWLSLEADRCLPPDKARILDQHVAGCPACRKERESYAALAALLEGARLPVRPDFKAQVMAALPAAGWEGRQPRAWSVPAAICLLLGGLAVYLLGHGAAGLSTASSALLALGGMVRAAVEAGAGLLNASWKGVGMVAQESLSSRTGLAVFGVFVLCINLLLISLIRRKTLAGRAGASARGGAGR